MTDTTKQTLKEYNNEIIDNLYMKVDEVFDEMVDLMPTINNSLCFVANTVLRTIKEQKQ